MANLHGLLASPGLDQNPAKAIYFFPGEGSDDSLWTTHPLDIRDRHWNSDDSTRGWVLDRMVAAHVNTVVASWWSTLPESSPMALTSPRSPISPSWQWLVDAVGTRPLVILPAIESGLDPRQWQFADEFPSSEPAGLVDRIGWLCDAFAGRMERWARIYDAAGNPRYAVNIIHTCSHLLTPDSDAAFADGFNTVATAVRDRYQIDVGFTLDTIVDPYYSAIPLQAGSHLAHTASILAIHGFESEIFSPAVHPGDNNADGNISNMADWKRKAMNDWIATGVPVILDVSNGYDGRKVFGDATWHWGDTADSTDDRWRNWMSQLKNPSIAGISVDCWNGYTEGFAMVPSREHGDTAYNWLTDLLEPDPRGGNHMHYVNGVATHRVFGAICEKWIALGADRSFGAPVTDELASGPGRKQEFTDGKSIYWGPQTGAFELHGLIAMAYCNAGGGSSRLGLPTSDEQPSGNGRLNRFQHGEITWKPGDTTAQIHLF